LTIGLGSEIVDRPVTPIGYLETGTIYCDENVRRLAEFPAECVDLIYLDPPFFSNKNYEVIWGDEAEVRSFEDRWEGGIDVYVAWMRERLMELYRVLKPAGSVYLHCDWHATHRLRTLMDAIFQPKNFRNEIVWRRTPFAGSSKALARQYPRSHDTLLFYSNGNSWTWNQPTRPYSEKYLARFKWDDGDGRGPYRKSTQRPNVRKAALEAKPARNLSSGWNAHG
jgi:DNA modification methylase